jgi:hypothetical protein
MTSPKISLRISERQAQPGAAAQPATNEHLLPEKGEMFVIKAQKGVTYSLVDEQTSKPVKNQRALRKGDHLEVEVDGEVVLEVQDFFTSAPAPEAEGGAHYLAEAGGEGAAEAVISANSKPVSQDNPLMWSSAADSRAVGITDSEVAVAPVVAGVGAVLGGFAAGGTALALTAEGNNNLTALEAVVDDINGNANGALVTAQQLNSIEGLTGAVEGRESAYSSAFATAKFADKNNPTCEEIQLIITAYNLILDAAESAADDAFARPTATHYAALGLGNLTAAEVNLLGQVIDHQTNTAVDTNSELKLLTAAVTSLVKYDGTPANTAPSKDQVNTLLTGSSVTDASLADAADAWTQALCGERAFDSSLSPTTRAAIYDSVTGNAMWSEVSRVLGTQAIISA